MTCFKCNKQIYIPLTQLSFTLVWQTKHAQKCFSSNRKQTHSLKTHKQILFSSPRRRVVRLKRVQNANIEGLELLKSKISKSEFIAQECYREMKKIRDREEETLLISKLKCEK
ncbi:Hypothetical_protein [Hexamita inflata]|uniref:Hypothetical_protein n=1 Tax=Hexamita inflata TaxID=28002 RepID=A0AA86PHY6_9EUKA|nr:Hypothetical protein HINF_LOCUS23875 [Hexamita inflata]